MALKLTDGDRERLAGKDAISLRDEIAVARLTVEAVINSAKTPDDFAAKADTINALLLTIACLIEKAAKLEWSSNLAPKT